MKRWHKKKGIEDHYGTEAIRTESEFLLEGYIKKAGLPYLVNQVFCFSCQKWFTWEHRDIPSICGFCKIGFKTKNQFNTEKGYLCRPDILISLNKPREFNVKKLSVLRVDGDIHKFSKAVRIADYHILHNLLRLGIRVFIIRNEELIKKSSKEIDEMVAGIKGMIKYAVLYKVYLKSKEFEEVSYCPDIQSRHLLRRR